MVFRCEYRQTVTDAQCWGTLLFGNSGTRALRLSRLRGRQLARSMTGELLSQKLLSEFAPKSSFFLDEDADGKPFVSGSPFHISISHSGGYVAAAVADRPLGIDLQELRRISDAVLRRCFSPAERSWIDAGDPTERAIRLWTMKEAYGKLYGRGIFSGKPFCAVFSNGRIETEYANVTFLFQEGPEGFLFTVCLAK